MKPLILFFIAGIVACNNERKPWTEEERSGFVSSCITEASRNNDETRAAGFCDCMQKKIEGRFSYKEYKDLPQSAIQDPPLSVAVDECLGLKNTK